MGGCAPAGWDMPEDPDFKTPKARPRSEPEARRKQKKKKK